MSTSLASNNWQPAASLDLLAARARLLRCLRGYFESASVTEVVTPALSSAATTDPHIESFHSGARPLYLHTSPEFPMKRLLCAGSGDIYQICTVFRREESGHLHNPEFQLLEWYRCGFDHHRLMQEMETLVSQCWNTLNPDSPCPQFRKLRYYDAIQSATGLAHAELEPERIADFLQSSGIDCPLQWRGPHADRLDVWLDFLMSIVVAPSFSTNSVSDKSGDNTKDVFTFLYDYPASQAALARLVDSPDDPEGQVAARFELFFADTELANGFYELDDANEQRQRFESDLSVRRSEGLAAVPMDTRLLAALEAGLPDCAGVALGLDRLLMVLTSAASITDVLTFPIDRA